MIRISAVYPNVENSRFDGDYYLNRHAPFAEKLLTPHGLSGLSLTLGVAGLDGAPPPFWAISELIFPTRAAFDAAIAACGEALFADTKAYTDITPVLQISRTANEPAS
ncbi:EthD family reductase [Aquisediminimonas sediminicola]|uniref:EthD family reductase n=1 Tax=Alteraquisediminimonas sediminicola TaxID=2676787 RepID=UPI001C8E8478